MDESVEEKRSKRGMEKGGGKGISQQKESEGRGKKSEREKKKSVSEKSEGAIESSYPLVPFFSFLLFCSSVLEEKEAEACVSACVRVCV